MSSGHSIYSKNSYSESGELKLKLRNELHLLRKIWHFGAGFIGLVAHVKFGMTGMETGKILVALSILAFIFETLRLKFEFINQFVLKIMGPLMRESEKNSYSGFVFYALGAGLSLLFFPEKIAILSILFLMIADPVSSLIGVRFGKEMILPNKSLQGTLAGFFTCYLLTLLYCLSYSGPKFEIILISIFGGIIGAVSELMSIWADDNLTIPVVSGAGLTLINLNLHVL